MASPQVTDRNQLGLGVANYCPFEPSGLEELDIHRYDNLNLVYCIGYVLGGSGICICIGIGRSWYGDVGGGRRGGATKCPQCLHAEVIAHGDAFESISFNEGYFLEEGLETNQKNEEKVYIYI